MKTGPFISATNGLYMVFTLNPMPAQMIKKAHTLALTDSVDYKINCHGFTHHFNNTDLLGLILVHEGQEGYKRNKELVG